MLVNKSKLLLILAIGLLMSAVMSGSAFAVPVDANYTVRPLLRVGSGVAQDGLQVNGPTNATQSQNVVGESWSTVDLATGTVKMYAEGNGAQPGLQTYGGFSERLTIQGGGGTTWNMGFDLIGEISGGLGSSAPGGPRPQVFYNLGIVVFQAGVANYTNVLGIAGDSCWGQDTLNCTPAPAPLANVSFSDIISIPVDDYPSDDTFSLSIDENILASVLLPSNNVLLDLFVYTNVIVSTGSAGSAVTGVTDYVSDFSNTATFGQTFAPGVNAYSSSGQFMGLSTPPQSVPTPPQSVPEPATFALFGIGLAGLGFARKKRKSA